MARKVLFVQFTHPGGEHRLTPQEQASRLKDWNYGGHQRKFLKAPGQIVTNSGLSIQQELLFWGEWEPTSFVDPVTANIGVGVLPNWVHTPVLFYNKNDSLQEHVKISKMGPVISGCCSSRCPLPVLCPQNTDPFVFAPTFYYSLCKQEHFTRLRELEKGSIILFGSTINKPSPYFAIDTVFVVGEYREYTPDTYSKDLARFISKDYEQIMGFKFWQGTNTLVCYKGATYDNPVNGMYSFVPCKPKGNALQGFARVRITSKDLPTITDNLNASPKYTEGTLEDNLKIWNKLRDLVNKVGLFEGVNFEYQRIV